LLTQDQLFIAANLNLVGFALHKNYVTQHNEGARARRHAALGGTVRAGAGEGARAWYMVRMDHEKELL
jgi:hypothetical protein